MITDEAVKLLFACRRQKSTDRGGKQMRKGLVIVEILGMASAACAPVCNGQVTGDGICLENQVAPPRNAYDPAW